MCSLSATTFAQHVSSMDTSSSGRCNLHHQHHAVERPLQLLQQLSDFSIEHILHRAGDSFASRQPTDYALATPDRRQPEHQHHHIRLQHQQQDQLQFEGKLCKLNGAMPLFNWLQYTRYHPPRAQKSHLKPSATTAAAPVRRTPGRLPRVPFSAGQLSALELAYRQSTYLSAEAANRLADQLQLTSTRVKIWFQNRRARERRERRERGEPGDEVSSATSSSTMTTI